MTYFSRKYFTKFVAKKWWQQTVYSWIDRKGPVWKWIVLHVPKNTKVLDYGCGPGWFVRYLADNYSVTGVDLSEEAILMARLNVPNAKFVVGDIKLVKEKKFKFVTCFDVLEHINKSEHKVYFASFLKIMTNDGYLIVSVPITDSLMKKIKGKNWWAYEDKTHVCLQKRQDWLDEFKTNGYQLIKLYSSGLINHPLPQYKLVGWQWVLHAITQIWGMLGGYLSGTLSDVDFYILKKDPAVDKLS